MVSLKQVSNKILEDQNQNSYVLFCYCYGHKEVNFLAKFPSWDGFLRRFLKVVTEVLSFNQFLLDVFVASGCQISGAYLIL